MTTRLNDWNGLTLSNGCYHITGKFGEGGMGRSTAPWTRTSTPTSSSRFPVRR